MFFGMYPAMGVALYRRGAMDNLMSHEQHPTLAKSKKKNYKQFIV